MCIRDRYEQNLMDAKGSITGIGITVNKGDNNEIKIVEIAEKGPQSHPLR